MIDITLLTVHVAGFTLDGASFRVPAGGVGVVTGPTGAGKTTLLETIAGVRPLSGGTIVLDARDVTRVAPEQRGVGLVYQQAWLFPHLTVRKNVEYGARDAAVVQALMRVLHIDALVQKPVPTLSGGERQLVALARALARAPRTLLLDEPFAAMDSALRGGVRTAVLSWAREHGMTTLLVTHDATEAMLPGSVQLRVERGVVTTAA